MRLSERIYRILLRAYPNRYLCRYGEPMAQLFSDQLQRASGAGLLVRLWLRTMGDLSRTVPARYFERLLPNRGAFSRYNEAARRSIFFARYEAAMAVLRPKIFWRVCYAKTVRFAVSSIPRLWSRSGKLSASPLVPFRGKCRGICL